MVIRECTVHREKVILLFCPASFACVNLSGDESRLFRSSVNYGQQHGCVTQRVVLVDLLVVKVLARL